MRHLLSGGCGFGAAAAFLWFLEGTVAFGRVELLVICIGVFAIVATWAFSQLWIRRAAVRLRIASNRLRAPWSRVVQPPESQSPEQRDALQRSDEDQDPQPPHDRHSLDHGQLELPSPRGWAFGVRRLAMRLTDWTRDPRLKHLEAEAESASVRERFNPMWLSYVALTAWALYDVVAVSDTGPSPFEAASTAAMVTSSAAFVTLDAHSDTTAAGMTRWLPLSAACPAAPRRDAAAMSTACSGEAHCACGLGHESTALIDVPALVGWIFTVVPDPQM